MGVSHETTPLSNSLVTAARPIGKVIQCLQRDQTMGSLTLLSNARGNAPVKRIKRSTAELKQQHHTLAPDCNYVDSFTACYSDTDNLVYFTTVSLTISQIVCHITMY